MSILGLLLIILGSAFVGALAVVVALVVWLERSGGWSIR